VQKMSVRSIKISGYINAAIALSLSFTARFTPALLHEQIFNQQTKTTNQQALIKNPQFLLFVPHLFFSNNETCPARDIKLPAHFPSVPPFFLLPNPLSSDYLIIHSLLSALN